MAEESLSKTARTKVEQHDRVIAVNNWRGQCLDNFARVEHAVVKCLQMVEPLATIAQFRMGDTAASRTRGLRDGLENNWSNLKQAHAARRLLELWAIREKERNDLVHGRFLIKPGINDEWLLINETLTIKNGDVASVKKAISANQAKAFLQAIAEERRSIEQALRELIEAISLDNG